jgi:hypothetical protein
MERDEGGPKVPRNNSCLDNGVIQCCFAREACQTILILLAGSMLLGIKKPLSVIHLSTRDRVQHKGVGDDVFVIHRYSLIDLIVHYDTEQLFF